MIPLENHEDNHESVMFVPSANPTEASKTCANQHSLVTMNYSVGIKPRESYFHDNRGVSVRLEKA